MRTIPDNRVHETHLSDKEWNAIKAFMAIPLCLPGFFCWFVYLGGFRFASQRVIDLAITLMIVSWYVAIPTAVVSLFLYVRWPFWKWPWYSWLNLAINIPGLLFTAGMLAGSW